MSCSLGSASARTASARSTRPSYRARPTITPLTPSGSRGRRDSRSAMQPMPPEAITGTLLLAAMVLRASRFGPARVPSVAISVVMIAAIPELLKVLARSVARTSLCSIQPRVATRPSLASIPTTIRPGYRSARDRTRSGCSIATVPRITRSRPQASNCSARSRERTPPPSCTGISRADVIAWTAESFTGSPRLAPSRSTRCSRVAPCCCQLRA